MSKKTLKKTKDFEEVMMITPEIFRDMMSAVDNYKRLVNKETSQVGSGKEDRSVPVSHKRSNGSSIFGGQEEDEEMNKLLLKVREYEMNVGNKDASTLFKKLMGLRGLLKAHVRQNVPLPNGYTLEKLVGLINNTQKKFLQKYQELKYLSDPKSFKLPVKIKNDDKRQPFGPEREPRPPPGGPPPDDDNDDLPHAYGGDELAYVQTYINNNLDEFPELNDDFDVNGNTQYERPSDISRLEQLLGFTAGTLGTMGTMGPLQYAQKLYQQVGAGGTRASRSKLRPKFKYLKKKWKSVR